MPVAVPDRKRKCGLAATWEGVAVAVAEAGESGARVYGG